MDKFLKNLFIVLGVTVLGLLLGALLDAGSNSEFTSFSLQLSNFYSTYAMIFLFVGFLGGLLFTLSSVAKKLDKNEGKAKVQDKDGLSKFYDQHWCTEKELETNPKYLYTTYDALPYKNKVGFPIRAQMVNSHKMKINMYDKDFHCLVIGTTGAGKTTQYMNPMIQIFGESAVKPSMVITDPKGELYNLHSEKLRKKGYRIIVFDLADPFRSTRWNPMDKAYMLHQRALNIHKEVKVHTQPGDTPDRYPNLRKFQGTTYGNEWYEFNGMAFADRPTLDRNLKSKAQALDNEAEEDLKDIATALCPIKDLNQPRWEEGARGFVLGVMMAMLEDSGDPSLGMTREKFNFYNVARICNTKDNDINNPQKTICEYFLGRDPLSHAVQSASEVVSNTEKTRTNYMGIVSGYVSVFADSGICYATSVNEMDLTNFDNQSTALFIKIPDEKQTRHAIATIFITQLYKILVEIARQNGIKANDDTKAKLSHPTYFLLDEFANMPKIEEFEKKIAIGRSRRIFFCLILQAYSQLTNLYGQQASDIIKDNCNMHVYIASNDSETKKAFSERCGNITVTTETTSVSHGSKKEDGKSTSTSQQKDQRPLIYPDELGSLKDELIVSILKEPPIKTKFTPSYLATNIYSMTPPPPSAAVSNYFDEHEFFYDISKRNKMVLKPTSRGGFDVFS